MVGAIAAWVKERTIVRFRSEYDHEGCDIHKQESASDISSRYRLLFFDKSLVLERSKKYCEQASTRRRCDRAPRNNSKVTLFELRSEFFQCGIFADDFPGVSTVQSGRSVASWIAVTVATASRIPPCTLPDRNAVSLVRCAVH